MAASAEIVYIMQSSDTSRSWTYLWNSTDQAPVVMGLLVTARAYMHSISQSAHAQSGTDRVAEIYDVVIRNAFSTSISSPDTHKVCTPCFGWAPTWSAQSVRPLRWVSHH
ncbi:hypothetical protein DOTSEDRAFT_41063 [Dothistroma septosporum NZE10]|uniref:Uncharacterized protein n=1 Tax=Dothistroma septosporum (strain NZE10 / CBS 128990) TaxID=675120 RepID=N1Q4U9_DOTSN|nr:hypothetical protein DOTSEDRAFT_41063 [Dothistroma septosporum NZE10]